MQVWTTFSPQKVCWELTTVQNKGVHGSNDWLQHRNLIEMYLKILVNYGISGIRLVIYPPELTEDGTTFNWEPVDTMLILCKRLRITVVFCIGPFQYPYYPGIYLPDGFHNKLSDSEYLDSFPELKKYSLIFLSKQLERYGNNNLIKGFHLANEWPDMQVVAGMEKIKKAVSESFMIEIVQIIKRLTKKQVYLNTNIDAADKNNLKKTFKSILEALGNQGKLGFDIYPSQEGWRNVPLQKLLRLFVPFNKSFRWACQELEPCELFFAEVEAQPWGDGRSWYSIVKSAPNPEDEILTYTPKSLEKTWKNHIKFTECNIISLWGSDFWLSAYEMGFKWPLNAVKEIGSYM